MRIKMPESESHIHLDFVPMVDYELPITNCGAVAT